MNILPYAQKFIDADDTIRRVAAKEEVLWLNDRYLPYDMVASLCQLVVSTADISDAAARLKRFAPFIVQAFPETAASEGLIDSPLREIPAMKNAHGENTAAPPTLPSRSWRRSTSVRF